MTSQSFIGVIRKEFISGHSLEFLDLIGRRWSVQTRQNKCIDFKLWFMVLRHCATLLAPLPWAWGPGPKELTPALSVPHPPTDPQQMLPSHACCLHNLCNCSTILPKPGELQVHLFSNDVQWSNKQGHEASLGNDLLGTKHPHKVQICSIRHAGFQQASLHRRLNQQPNKHVYHRPWWKRQKKRKKIPGTSLWEAGPHHAD